MILVTTNERQQVFRCKNIAALTHIFFTYIKKRYTLQETDKENITSFQTGPLLL